MMRIEPMRYRSWTTRFVTGCRIWTGRQSSPVSPAAAPSRAPMSTTKWPCSLPTMRPSTVVTFARCDAASAGTPAFIGGAASGGWAPAARGAEIEMAHASARPKECVELERKATYQSGARTAARTVARLIPAPRRQAKAAAEIDAHFAEKTDAEAARVRHVR